MILVLNAGNTHVQIGLFMRGRLRATWKLSSDTRRTGDEYALQLGSLLGEEAEFQGAILSSVVPRITPALTDAVAKATHVVPMILGPATPIGIVNGYQNPEEVGMDRLANAVSATLLHGAPVMVLDFGTAVTLDYTSAPEPPEIRPIYRGGAIMPGIQMAAESLARGTAKLPPIDVDLPPQIIGRTTVESIRSGLVHGYIGAARTLIDLAREEIGIPCKVIATGGDAERFKDALPGLHAIEPDLTLYGLRQIYGITHDCPLGKPLGREG